MITHNTTPEVSVPSDADAILQRVADLEKELAAAKDAAKAALKLKQPKKLPKGRPLRWFGAVVPMYVPTAMVEVIKCAMESPDKRLILVERVLAERTENDKFPSD